MSKEHGPTVEPGLSGSAEAASVTHLGSGDINQAGRDINITKLVIFTPGAGSPGPEVQARERAVKNIGSLFVSESFLNVVLHDERSPELLDCTDLRTGRGSRTVYSVSGVNFHIHIQTDNSAASSIQEGRERILSCYETVETKPVVILRISFSNGRTTPVFRMLCLHDWLIRNALMSRSPLERQKWDYQSADFVRIDSAGKKFHEKLIEEAARAEGSDGAPWRTLRDYGLVPVDEVTFLEFIEFARFLEIPTRAFERLARSSGMQITQALRRFLASGDATASDPMVRDWLSSIQELAPARHNSEFERRQFRQFARLISRSGNGVRLPKYRGTEVGCWRSFVSMYPESVKGLAHILRTSPHGNDVAFAAAMLPMLALSADSRVEREARDALRILVERAQDFRSYEVRRELLRAPAEAGDHVSLERAISLITREGAAGAESRFLSRYGWTSDIVEENINRKLGNPTYRDVNLRDFYTAMGDIVTGS